MIKSKRLKRRLRRKIIRSIIREEAVSIRGAKKKPFRLTRFDAGYDRFSDDNSSS